MVKLLWPSIKCNSWLLFHMHKGYCMYTEEENGSTILIAASLGSIWDGTLEVVKVFYKK